MLWIALYIVAGLAGLIVVIAVIGSFLPRDHVATRSATLPAPPDTVWRALADLDGQVRWRRGLKRVEHLSPTTFREHTSQGAIVFELVEDRAPVRRVTRIADDKLPFGGKWIYELSSTGDGAGTRLTITEDGFIKNPIFRFMSKTIFSTTATMERFLADLANHLA